VHETHNPQIWEKLNNAMWVLADQVSISSQNRNVLGSAHNEAQVAASLQ
jgi:hypothetical protein